MRKHDAALANDLCSSRCEIQEILYFLSFLKKCLSILQPISACRSLVATY